MGMYILFFERDRKPAGRIVRNFVDDLDALDAARALAVDCAVEIYRDNAFVARVNLGDRVLDSRDRQSL